MCVAMNASRQRKRRLCLQCCPACMNAPCQCPRNSQSHGKRRLQWLAYCRATFAQHTAYDDDTRRTDLGCSRPLGEREA